jgi:serine/threonine-protein kinase RsbW
MCAREEKGPAEILLHGPMGVGKSVLVRKLYWWLFDHQDVEIPVYCAVPSGPFSPLPWARRFFMETALQCAAFELRDDALAAGALPSVSELTNLCYDTRLYPFAEALKNLWREDPAHAEGTYAIEWVFDLLRAAVERLDRRVTLLIDDADNARFIERGQVQYLAQIAQAFPERGLLRRVWTARHEETAPHPGLPPAPSAGERLEIPPLSQEAALAFFARLGREKAIDFDKGVLTDYLPLWGNIPRWLAHFAAQAAHSPRALAAPDHFIQPYVEDIQQGASGRWLMDAIQKAGWGRPHDPVALGRVAHESLYWEHAGYRGRGAGGDLSEPEEEALRQLGRAGLAQYRQGRWEAPDIPILGDFLRLFIARHHRGENVLRSQIALKRKRLVETPARAGRRKIDQRLTHVAALMHTFREQHVPDRFFNCHKIGGEFLEDADLGALDPENNQAAGLLQRDKDRPTVLRLPYCIGAFSLDNVLPGRRDVEESPCVVGWCFEGPECFRSEETLWIAHLSDAVALTSEEVDRMERINRRLTREFNVRRVVGWVITDGRFSEEALERVEALQFLVSNWEACEDLGERLLKKPLERDGRATFAPPKQAPLARAAAREAVPRVEPASPPRPAARILSARPEAPGKKSVELYLPPQADMELVAAGTLEKLAYNAGFDQGAVGQMKMAVLEGCLNAIERSRNAEKLVRVCFETRDENFVILIENEGVRFDPQMVEEPTLEKKMGQPNKRGWGLRLMRKFMDKVVFEPFEGGTRLRLEKKLPVAAPERAAGKG